MDTVLSSNSHSLFKCYQLCQQCPSYIFIFLFQDQTQDIRLSLPFFVVQSISHVQLFVTPWAVAHPAPLSIGFPRQEEYQNGFHFILQGIFLAQGLNLHLLYCQADALQLGKPRYPFTFLSPRAIPQPLFFFLILPLVVITGQSFCKMSLSG